VSEQGILTSLQSGVLTDPGASEGSVAEVQVHPGGRHVLVSNRRGDQSSLTVLGVESDGRLRFHGQELTYGRTPRHFAISRDGFTVIAANQDSNSVTLFSFEPETSRLIFRASHPTAPKPFFVSLR
jgi:6-phosphogluconolactonase